MGYVVRGIAGGGSFRVFAVECRDAVEEARRLQGLSPTATAALGRLMAAAALLASDLKTGRILIQVKGDGPLGEILAEGDAEGNLRATVSRPWVHLEPKDGKLSVGEAVGRKGFISVVKDLGLKEPYQGSVSLVSGEIAKDLAYYLTVSEQVPSAVALGVLVDRDGSVKAAGGFMIQRMPSAGDEEVERLEKVLGSLPPVTSLLSQGKTPEAILRELFSDVEVLEKRLVRFKCRCSRKRVESMLLALGRAEVEEMIRKGERVSVLCHFCGKEYAFSVEDLKRLLGDEGKEA